MKSYFHKFASLGVGWNERELTEDDFFNLCEQHEIIAHVEPLNIRGVYYRLFGRDFISVSNRLSSPQRLQVMFHELGHFLMHAPGFAMTAGFSGLFPESREEAEAEAFAFCAILPLKMLRSRLDVEIAEMFGNAFFRRRLAVYERYGI